MHDVETVMRNLIEITEFPLAGGWRGWAAVRAAGKDKFSREDWITLLSEPGKLLEGAERTLKEEGDNLVIVKYMTIGNKGVKAVLKSRKVKGFFKSLAAPRALKNFIAAVKTKQYGLPVAAPLAAVYHRKALFCDQSIYISEYIEGPNLYEFLKNVPAAGSERIRIMKRLSNSLAEIFAGLHGNNLWHRDAKATNFIVWGYSSDNYRIFLTDMDGIKQNSANNRENQMRGLWQLAASVMDLQTITNTDYLRVFRAYCEKMDIPAGEGREMLLQIIDNARTKYRRNIRRTES
jgi:tRNA A-37 threonylcarbamoyl transferase component Bud32